MFSKLFEDHAKFHFDFQCGCSFFPSLSLCHVYKTNTDSDLNNLIGETIHSAKYARESKNGADL